MIFSPAPASHFLIMMTLLPMGMEKSPTGHSAVMWKSGTAISCTPFGSGFAAAAISPIFIAVPTLRWVWTTPFGNPVEPEVYLEERGEERGGREGG